MSCAGFTTGSRRLDEILEIGSPSVVGIYGGGAAGKSHLLYCMAVAYAYRCGAALLVDAGGVVSTDHLKAVTSSYPTADPILDRLLVSKVSDEDSMFALASSLPLLGAGLVLVDDASDSLGWSRSPAVLSYLSLVVSRLSSSKGIKVIMAFSAEHIQGSPEEIPHGYEYSWPFVDFFVKLEVERGGIRRAIRGGSVVRFRLTPAGVHDVGL